MKTIASEKRSVSQCLGDRLPLAIFILLSVWFIFSFLIFPNLTVLRDTFVQDGQLTLSAFSKIAGSNRAMQSIFHSFLLSIILSITVSIVGMFLLLVTEYFDVKGARILRIGFMSTLVFSGMILNSGYLYVYGNNGILTRALTRVLPGLDPMWFQGFPAVLFVMTFACTSNHMLFGRNAVRGLDYGMIEAAQNMGASQWTILRRIVFPTLTPTILTLFVMAFQTGVGAMSAPLMVGGRDFQTIAPLILTLSKIPTSRDIAALLSLLLGAVQILVLYIITMNEKKGNFLSISKTKVSIRKQKIQNPVANVIVHIISYVLFAIYTVPLILVLLFSFMDTQFITTSQLSVSGFTLKNYAKILTDPASFEPFLNSVIYSGLAAFAVVFAMVIVVRMIMRYKNRWSTLLEYLFYIPWLLPSLMIALGLILAYSVPTPMIFGQVSVGNQWVVPIAYAIVLIPMTLRYLKTAYYSFDQNLEEAGRVLGANSFTILRKIIIPALLPTALALFALNFNGKLADYDLSAFLYAPTNPTLGIVIRANAEATATADAKAINLVYSVILVVISTIVLYLVYGRGEKTAVKKSGLVQK